MNWLKTNVIGLLVAGSTLLLIGLLVSIAMYQHQRADFSKVQSNYNTLVDTNKGNVTRLKTVTAEFNDLVRKRSLDIQKAEDAARELAEFKQATAATYEENRQLRDALKRRSPETRSYLEQGMPRELACTLWPERC